MHWDPDLIVIFGGTFATVVAWRLLSIVSSRVNRPGPDVQEIRAMRERMDEIGTAVDAIAIEVERIAEAQRFSTQLLVGSRKAEGGSLKAEV